MPIWASVIDRSGPVVRGVDPVGAWLCHPPILADSAWGDAPGPYADRQRSLPKLVASTTLPDGTPRTELTLEAQSQLTTGVTILTSTPA